MGQKVCVNFIVGDAAMGENVFNGVDMKRQKRTTVGYLKKFLSGCDPNMPITFGSSRYRKRPLIFYRFHFSGMDKLLIELNELDKGSEDISECEARITVSDILKELNAYDDDIIVSFGSSLDAVPLEFRDIEKAVAINLIQTEEPQWEVSDD